MGMIKLKGTNGSVDESEKLSVQSCNIAADAGSQNDASHRRWEDPSVLKELTDHADGYRSGISEFKRSAKLDRKQ